jgi:WD40 repeat protein
MPTATLIPSPTQTPVATPETEIGPQEIEPANAGQVVELARLGKGTILSAPVYSPDGKWVAIPGAAGIYIYDANTLEELRRIPQGTSFIAVSPDGSILAASGRDSISLWNPATGVLLGELPGIAGGWHWELSFSPDGSLLAASTSEREIFVWSVATGERLFEFAGDSLRFSPDGELAVVNVYGEDWVYLYETRGGVEVNKWKVHMAGFAPGGQLWLEDAGSVRLVDMSTGTVTAPFSGAAPSFSADGRLMALFANNQISLYDHQKGRREQMLEGSSVQIDSLLFSPDGKTVAGDVYVLKCPTCTEMEGLDRLLVLWRVADGSIVSQLEHPSGWLAYSTDGSSVAAAQIEGVQVVLAADGSIVNRIDGFAAPVEGMALSPDGRTLAAVHAKEPYTLRFWDLESGQVARALQNPLESGALYNVEVAYSPGGDYLAVGGDIWDLAAGQRLTEMEQAIVAETSCWSSSVAFSPEGNTLATGCFDGQLDLWSVPDGALLKRMGGYSSWVNGLAYSPDGNYLAAVYSVPDYLVQVWQLPEGKPAFKLTGGRFTRVAYSPDGSTLATVAANQEYDHGHPAGFVQLWSASSGEEIAHLDVEDAISIAFSPDSQILATGSFDGTLRLWEIAGGNLLMEANGHYDLIQRVAFTPEGTGLVSGSRDGAISLWGIPVIQ